MQCDCPSRGAGQRIFLRIFEGLDLRLASGFLDTFKKPVFLGFFWKKGRMPSGSFELLALFEGDGSGGVEHVAGGAAAPEFELESGGAGGWCECE